MCIRRPAIAIGLLIASIGCSRQPSMTDLIATYAFESAELDKLQANADRARAIDEALAVRAFASQFLFDTIIPETTFAELDKYIRAMPDEKAAEARSWIESKKRDYENSEEGASYRKKLLDQLNRVQRAKSALDKARG